MSIFTWRLGPLRWTPHNYDHISGYRHVFWRFWIRVNTPAMTTAPKPTARQIPSGLDLDEDF